MEENGIPAKVRQKGQKSKRPDGSVAHRQSDVNGNGRVCNETNKEVEIGVYVGEGRTGDVIGGNAGVTAGREGTGRI